MVTNEYFKTLYSTCGSRLHPYKVRLSSVCPDLVQRIRTSASHSRHRQAVAAEYIPSGVESPFAGSLRRRLRTPPDSAQLFALEQDRPRMQSGASRAGDLSHFRSRLEYDNQHAIFHGPVHYSPVHRCNGAGAGRWGHSRRLAALWRLTVFMAL